MTELKNFYTASEVNAGDVFLCYVKAIVVHKKRDGTPVVRVYRCPSNFPEGTPHSELPQGDQVLKAKEVAEGVFPVLAWFDSIYEV